MRKSILPVLIMLCFSCNFETKKISSEEVLEQESKALNWKEVDEYPAFEECQNLSKLTEARSCFERKINQIIIQYLTSQKPVVTKGINDTVYLFLEIDKTGNPEITQIEVDTTVTNQLPEIEKWLKNSIDSLPKIYPANKRGIPVSTVFKMPVVVKAE